MIGQTERYVGKIGDITSEQKLRAFLQNKTKQENQYATLKL